MHVRPGNEATLAVSVWVLSDKVPVVCRLEKLRSVLSLFQTKVSDMEQKQDHQRGMAQHSLKKEMIALQKKMMQQAVCQALIVSYKPAIFSPIVHTYVYNVVK